MSLRFEDRWMWDFWFAEDAGEVHLVYLYAPKSLGDPELRHQNARIGHAVSGDGTHVLYGDRLDGPSVLEGDQFLSGDNGPSMYAGRAIEHAGRWWFLAWDRLDAAGDFVGALSDPFPLDVVDDTLVVDFGKAVRATHLRR